MAITALHFNGAPVPADEITPDYEDYLLELIRQDQECKRYEREHQESAFGLFSLSSNGIAAQQPTRDWDLELAPF